jgi:hypothetical protein
MNALEQKLHNISADAFLASKDREFFLEACYGSLSALEHAATCERCIIRDAETIEMLLMGEANV